MNYVISILSPESLGTLTGILKKLELNVSVILHGKGTASKNMLDILGIENSEKRLVLTVASPEKTKKLIELEKERMFIGIPGHGFLTAIPIKSVGGGKTLAYLSGGEQNVKYTPDFNYSYELIVAIANRGRTDIVMNAARSAGATGGTVVHGKGTGTEKDQKFFNVSLAQEKEIVLIVAKSAQKSAIMKAIIEKAGPDTEAGTIAFSLPTSEVAGFGII